MLSVIFILRAICFYHDGTSRHVVDKMMNPEDVIRFSSTDNGIRTISSGAATIKTKGHILKKCAFL